MPPKKSLEDTYKKMSAHEHILARPDMYIGTIQRVEQDMWVFDEASQQMVQRKLSWVPGLYKIFDEILVNAADNKVRDFEGQTLMKVNIDPTQGKISVWNNGSGIPVEVHKEHKMYVPQMIFGHLLTSSSYDDTEDKVVGGRNGYGAKLTNVYSHRFELQTVHRGKKFSGKWSKNMLNFEEPEITSTTEDDFTMVTFYPDFARFNMVRLEEDITLLMRRRVYDVAGTTHKSMQVKLDGTLLPVRTFTDLVDLYPTLGEDKKNSCYARVGPRWEVCLRVSNIGFQHVSFVNCIATTRGGNHVRYIQDQIIEKVQAAAKKKDKSLGEIKPHLIKPHLFLFINSLISNPSFDSQTKETLNTTRTNFGSTCDLPQSLIDSFLKSGIVDRAVAAATSKLTQQIASKVKTSGDRSRINVPKLEDANLAGTKRGPECTLILTEGLSAKTFAMSGLSTIGRDFYGVYPLRGKLLNVRDSSAKRVLDCEEVQAILQIMGLKVDRKYEDVSTLRYGRIMIMSDQDHDGSHIKGLIVNLIHHFWPALLKIPGMLTHFITPIVKALPKSKRDTTVSTKSFFSLPDYVQWKESLTPDEARRYTFRYYKGLGTNSAAEAREYFSAIRQHRIHFIREDERDDEKIVMAFAKDRVDDRKRWITDFDGASFQQFDYDRKRMSYREFVDSELILFSVASCERAIPNVIDGLKPGQRKILYGCLKRNLVSPVKVSQLQGYVAEHSAYHHGDAALVATIVAMAQDHVGANNLPLLDPIGQFGSRSHGGKDAASARYIFTQLSHVTRFLYPKADDYLLDYKDDDGDPVEPHYYMPVIPAVLVNGTSGIGTGFSTTIPNFSPFDIIANMRRMLVGEDPVPMVPWYYGYKGSILPSANGTPGKFTTKGSLNVLPNGVVNITELPVGYWTSDYKKFLEDLIDKELCVTFLEHHTDLTVDFDVLLHPKVLEAWTEAGTLEDHLDLVSSLHATNIIGFNEREALCKFSNAEEVLKQFFPVRLQYYGKRRDYLLSELRLTCEKLENMVRFVKEVIAGTLTVSKKKKPVLLQELRDRGFKPFPPQSKKKLSKTAAVADEAEAEQATAGKGPELDDELTALVPGLEVGGDVEVPDSPAVAAAHRDYDYLLGLKLWSLTLEMVARLEAQLRAAKTELDRLLAKTPKDLWNEDLSSLEAAIKKYMEKREVALAETLRKKARKNALDPKGVRIPLLGDKARAVLEKQSDKAKAGAPGAKRPRATRKKKKDPDADSDELPSEDSDDAALMVAVVPKKKPARKPAAKKSRAASTAASDDGVAAPKPRAKRTIKTKKQLMSDSSSDFSEDDDESEDSSSTEDSDAAPVASATRTTSKTTTAASKQTNAAPRAARKPPTKAARSEGASVVAVDTARVKAPAAATVVSSILDSDDDDTAFLLSAGTHKLPSPAKGVTSRVVAPPTKKSATPAAKKARKVHLLTSSEDESSSEDDDSSDF